MNAELRKRLVEEFALTEEQVGKLESEGVKEASDIALLGSDSIKLIAGCGAVSAIKIDNAFSTPPPIPVSDASVEIPEGTNPSADQVNTFAASMGMDPSIVSMIMLSSMTGSGAGIEGLDISSMVPIATIVAGYNPKNRDMMYMMMAGLERRLGDKPIVVIDEDGAVNRELTTDYVMALDEGFEYAEDDIHYDSDSVPHQVVRVGVDAQSVYDADPLDSTRALRKNGMGVGRVNWKGVSLEIKQVAFYGVETGEINPKNDASLMWLRENIKPGANRLTMQRLAPKALAKFNEAQRTGSLPTLRVMLERGPRRKEVLPRRRKVSPRDLSGIGKDEL